MNVRSGLLACDIVPDDLRDRFEDYPAMFAAAIAVAAVGWRYYRAFAGQLPQLSDECAAYLMTGSRSGAYDDEPWIPPLEDFIRRLFMDTRPLVGIRFGHQFIVQALARALGAAS